MNDEYKFAYNLLFRRCSAACHHRTDRSNETDTEDKPWTSSHETVRPTILVKCASGDSDDSDTKSSVHKGFVQVFALKRRHASIFSGFSVENEVDRDKRGAKNTGTIEETLLEIAGLNWILEGVALIAAKGLLEEVARRRKSA